MHSDALCGAAMLCDVTYVLGDWEATLRLVEELLADPVAPHWHDGALTLRALIRLGRNDLESAWSDVQRALEVADQPPRETGPRIFVL